MFWNKNLLKKINLGPWNPKYRTWYLWWPIGNPRHSIMLLENHKKPFPPLLNIKRLKKRMKLKTRMRFLKSILVIISRAFFSFSILILCLDCILLSWHEVYRVLRRSFAMLITEGVVVALLFIIMKWFLLQGMY